MKPSLVIVLGMPGSGKTTLAEKLSSELNMPLMAKDNFKNVLFDAFGRHNKDWSAKIGRASYGLMDYVIEEQLKAGQPLIVESTFDPKFYNQKFQKWQKEHHFKCVQVFCHTDSKIARQRFVDRVASDPLHPSGSEGREGIASFDNRIRDKIDQPLDLDGEVVKVDTTDFSKVDAKVMSGQIRTYLGA